MRLSAEPRHGVTALGAVHRNAITPKITKWTSDGFIQICTDMSIGHVFMLTACSCDTRASRHRAVVQIVRYSQREGIFVTLRIISSDNIRLRNFNILHLAEISLSSSKYPLAHHYTPLANVAINQNVSYYPIYVISFNALKRGILHKVYI